MGFELRLPDGEVILDLDIDPRLVKGLNIGPAHYAVPFNDDFAVINVEFRAATDLEFVEATKDEDIDYDVEDYIGEVRDYLGQNEKAASTTEAEVEEELKKEVGMKESLPKKTRAKAK